jgi:hypothetical protein
VTSLTAIVYPIANAYHRAGTSHFTSRRSSATTPGRPSARAVMKSATKAGLKMPRKRRTTNCGEPSAAAGSAPPARAARATATAAAQNAHVSA